MSEATVTTAEEPSATESVYTLEGTLIEACSCNVNCPCWIGEDPDLGECFAIIAYGIERGRIRDVDVSGLNLVLICHIPGNVLAGNWQVVALVDEKGSPEQREALLDAFTGKLGGPARRPLGGADRRGEGRRVRADQPRGGRRQREAERPGSGRDGDGALPRPRRQRHDAAELGLLDGPRLPAWIAKSSVHRVNLPQYGMTWEYDGRNAIQSEWKMEYAA